MEVIIDVESLTSVSNGINDYIKGIQEVEEAIGQLKLGNEDWNDDDFIALSTAINSFVMDIEALKKITNQLSARIENKINAIHKLHSMKI